MPNIAQSINLNYSKNNYFASDFHRGSPNIKKNLEREMQIALWLVSIEKKATEILLVVDVINFWIEYKHAIPKGFIRLQGNITDLKGSILKIHLFKGNHDKWIFNYLP